MRKENWPELLADELRAADARPFSFGVHDCCAFAARVVAAMTGRDLMAQFPAYDSDEGAQAILMAHGGMAGIWTHCLGEPIAVAYAQRGDVVMMPTERGDAAGICLGSQAAFAAPVGVACHALQQVTKAWRVG